MADLQRAIDQFNNEKTLNLKLTGLSTICTSVDPSIYPESPPHEAARKVFLKVLAKDLQTVDTLCKLVEDEHYKDPDDTDKRVHWMLATIYFISWNLHNSRFNGRLIDNGFINKLLGIAPELKEQDPRFWTFMILGRVIQCNFKSSSYLERSIYIKGTIFSKLAMFIDITEKAGSITLFVRRVIELFSNYLNTEEWEYYKSTVKSLLKDGTIFRITKMFSDMSNDRQFVDMYINNMIIAFAFITTCVQNTAYKYKLQQVELRLLNRMAIRHFPTVCKDLTGYALRNAALTITKVVGFGDKEDIQFYTDNKVFKMLASTFVSHLRSKEYIDYSKLNDVILCLIALGNSPQFQNSITLKDVRVLIPHLPDLVDSKKHTAAPPEFFTNRLLLASYAIMSKSNLLKEEHFNQLKASNILALFVETVKAYHGKNLVAEQLSLSMLMYCIAPEHLTCWLTLKDIDQVLPGIPLFINFLTGKDRRLPLNSGLDFAVSPICLFLVKNLLRIKEDRTCSIKPQLNALRESDFVSGIGQALIRAESSVIIFQLMEALDKSSQLFDNSEFMHNLLELLPELAEKQHRFLEVGNSFSESQAFMTECVSIMRKAAAYVLDDLDPIFVEDVIADQVIAGWISFRISGDKMFFSSNPDKTEEKFEVQNLCDESFIDVLRATWCMIGKYPDIINSKLPTANPLFQTYYPNSDITGLTSTRIIKTVISYLDHSQDKSSAFLTELTAFVKDLSHDSVSSEENKLLLQNLVPACERFLKVNNNKAFGENLQYFIDVNHGVMSDGYLLD